MPYSSVSANAEHNGRREQETLPNTSHLQEALQHDLTKEDLFNGVSGQADNPQ